MVLPVTIYGKAREEYDNQLISVRLGDFNQDKTALRVNNEELTFV